MIGTRRRGPRGGFTLIEIMVVILIIAILGSLLAIRLGGTQDSVASQNTRAFLRQIEVVLNEYEQEKGDFPASSFPKKLDPKPTKTNMGAEMLTISLFPVDKSFPEPAGFEDRFCNTDGDDTKRSVTSFTNSEVFEIADDWGNPIAYIHRRDYGEAAMYVTYDNVTGEDVEARVGAVTNPQTGDPFNRSTFQLLSAGADGVFNTEDDIGNFDPPPLD